MQEPRLVLDVMEAQDARCPHCGETEELERRNDKIVCQVCCRVFEVR